jgi:hypothetical protein
LIFLFFEPFTSVPVSGVVALGDVLTWPKPSIDDMMKCQGSVLLIKQAGASSLWCVGFGIEETAVARDRIRHTLKGYLLVICGDVVEDDVERMVVGKFAGGGASLRLLQ